MRHLVVAVLLLFSLGPVMAQESEGWQSWLMDNDAGRVVLVDAQGTVLVDVVLPVPALFPADYRYSAGLAVSPDGNRLLYGVNGSAADGTLTAVLVLYDVQQGEALLTYQPAQLPNASVLDLLAAPRLFHDTGSTFAYSYATIDNSGEHGWQIDVVDAQTADVLSSLRLDAPAFDSLDTTRIAAPFTLPVVQDYRGAHLDFTVVASETFAYATDYDNFRWDVLTGRVFPSNRYPTIAGDTLRPTGEVVLPVVDERLDYAEQYRPYVNALHAHRPPLGGRAPFFATDSRDILRADFVQNGERVLVLADDLLGLGRNHLLIDRAGTAQVLPPLQVRDEQIVGTPEGFLYAQEASQVIVAVDTRVSPPVQRPLWVAPTQNFVPVWVSPGTTLPDYTAWAQLAPPIYDSDAIQTPADSGDSISAQQVPTITPAANVNPDGVLTVNAVAFINTTEGDRLNMRNAPSLSAEIIARLEHGTRVTILQGPQSADGFIWWRVRIPGGLEGWVVERADGVQTLVPAN